MKRSLISFYTLLLVGGIVLSGCNAKLSEDVVMYEAESKQEIGFSKADTAPAESDSLAEESKAAESRKLIKRVYLSVETKEFDDFQLFIDKQIELMGGYIESAETSGNSYLQDKETRYSNLVIRIPTDKLNNLVETVGSESNILIQSSSQEDITLKYVDTESHNKALKVEQERLLLLLSKVEKLVDIIELEERLSKVRYEIESYESELRIYDNLVDYSTLTIDINEVSQITITPPVSETLGERIQSGLSNNLNQIKTDLQDLLVEFIIFLPYFIIWAIIITIIGFSILICVRKKRKRDLAKRAAKTDVIISENEKNKESQ